MRFYAYIYRDLTRMDAKGFPEAFYVGKGMNRRAYSHLSRKDRHPMTHRLQKMLSFGTRPHIEIIPALDEGHALFLEGCLIKIIGRKDLGLGPLLNLTDGGEGQSNPSEATRAKLSAAAKKQTWTLSQHEARRLYVPSEETRAKLSRVSKGRVMKAETKAKIGIANTNPSQETRIKMSLGNTNPSPERLLKMKDGVKLRNQSPEYRAKLSEAAKLMWAKRKASA